MKRLSQTFRTTIAVSTSIFIAACGGAGDAPAADTAASSAAPATAGGASAQLALGETKYGQVCASCHMADGKGSPGVFPPLAGSEWVVGDPTIPISIVLHGLQGSIEVGGVRYEGAMQPWGMIPDSDIAAILTYVRASFGNSASAVSTEQVTAIREEEGARVAWTAAELRAKYPG